METTICKITPYHVSTLTLLLLTLSMEFLMDGCRAAETYLTLRGGDCSTVSIMCFAAIAQRPQMALSSRKVGRFSIDDGVFLYF